MEGSNKTNKFLVETAQIRLPTHVSHLCMLHHCEYIDCCLKYLTSIITHHYIPLSWTLWNVATCSNLLNALPHNFWHIYENKHYVALPAKRISVNEQEQEDRLSGRLSFQAFSCTYTYYSVNLTFLGSNFVQRIHFLGAKSCILNIDYNSDLFEHGHPVSHYGNTGYKDSRYQIN